MRKKVGIALLILAGLGIFHMGMMNDQEMLCEQGRMEGKECQD